MAPVIWGLPLEEIKWSKFKSSYMWNNRYHLRRTKFIIYQAAMIFSVVGESLGTAAMSDYLDEQKYTFELNPNGYIYNNDIVGAFSYNIFAGVFVAFIFGAGFFFDLFWPERHEDHGIKLAWKYCAIAATIFQLAAALTSTIVLSTHTAKIYGVSVQEAESILGTYPTAPLLYRENKRATAAVVFGWFGFVFCVWATVVMWQSYAHNDKFGALADHVRKENDVEKAEDEKFAAGPAYGGYGGAADAPVTHTPQHNTLDPAATNYVSEPAPAHILEPSAHQSELDRMVQNEREPYNVATASTLNGTKQTV